MRAQPVRSGCKMSPGSLRTHIYGIFFVGFFSILEFRVTSIKSGPRCGRGNNAAQKPSKTCRRRSRKQVLETCLRGSRNLHRGNHAESFAETNNFVHYYCNFVKLNTGLWMNLEQNHVISCFHVSEKLLYSALGGHAIHYSM